MLQIIVVHTKTFPRNTSTVVTDNHPTTYNSYSRLHCATYLKDNNFITSGDIRDWSTT